MPFVTQAAGAIALAALMGFASSGLQAPRSQPTPKQPAPAAGEPVNGISCDAMEGMKIHIHQHITLLDHGKPVAIPPNVGQPMIRQCLYWVHTHTSDGIIHVES